MKKARDFRPSPFPSSSLSLFSRIGGEFVACSLTWPTALAPPPPFSRESADASSLTVRRGEQEGEREKVKKGKISKMRRQVGLLRLSLRSPGPLLRRPSPFHRDPRALLMTAAASRRSGLRSRGKFQFSRNFQIPPCSPVVSAAPACRLLSLGPSLPRGRSSQQLPRHRGTQ